MGNGIGSVWSRFERGISALAKVAVGALLVSAFILPACKGSAKCDGVEINGECQAKCVEAKCAEPGMKCVANACTHSCTDPLGCPNGQWCFGGVKADDGTEGQFCVTPRAKCSKDEQCSAALNQKCIGGDCRLTGCANNADCAAVSGPCVKDSSGDATKNYCDQNIKLVNEGDKCATSSECDTDRYSCVAGACRFVGCQTHDDCAGIGLCQSAKDDAGNDVLACLPGTTYPTGQWGTHCPGGPDGTDCDTANKFACLGNLGDIDAYCTKTGCQADSDCGTGYACETVRTSRVPCQTACGIPGKSTDPKCAAAADIGAGKEYSCGPVSLLRNICIKRAYCNECQSDDDCRGLPNQVCAKDKSGTKICTVVCDPNVPNACPWGNASECGTFDTALNKPTCAHRFGSCKGAGKDCEPCVTDTDCPGGLCVSSSFSGEQFCVDLSVSCDCTGLPVDQSVTCAGGGCPASPGGVTMQCYGGDAVKGSALYQKCYGADVSVGLNASPQTGCWHPL